MAPKKTSGRTPLLRGPEYKVVETSQVTDQDLEAILNDWTARGWALDGIQFAMRECSKRPAMAFVLFTRAAAPPDDDN